MPKPNDSNEISQQRNRNNSELINLAETLHEWKEDLSPNERREMILLEAAGTLQIEKRP